MNHLRGQAVEKENAFDHYVRFVHADRFRLCDTATLQSTEAHQSHGAF
jgi:hypothetical protein